MGRGTWLLLSGLGVGALVLVLLVLMDSGPDPVPAPPVPAKTPKPRHRPAARNDAPDWDEPRHEPPPPQAPAKPESEPAPSSLTGLPGYPASGNYGQEAQEDLRRLGPAAYGDLERLWTRGRNRRGHPDAQKALEELLDKFPGTHRAGCAAVELAMHRLKDARFSQKQRVGGAEELLRRTRTQYADSHCFGDVQAGHTATMLLATDVYRYSDVGMARTMLTELTELPPDVLDTRGQPMSNRAALLLKGLPQEPQALDDTAPK